VYSEPGIITLTCPNGSPTLTNCYACIPYS
jgi:hypothetical protein